MSTYIMIIIGGVLVNNYLMHQFLGICPFLGVSKNTSTAFGMGMAVTFVMALASLITYIIQYYLLVPFKLEYLQTIAFILVIAALVQIVETALKKISFSLYKALGVYLPLITTNCAVLGVTLLNVKKEYNLFESVTNGVGSALGFTLAIVIFAGIRECLEKRNLPNYMKGFSGVLISAGLMAIAFQGFSGLIK
ncbi:MAG: electron transport complex subunit RsxA [Eubacteriales bacterium]|nr:electron transport complex subunit RsxA [Eubacteriales bacterium]